jgi:hypothetical protein
VLVSITIGGGSSAFASASAIDASASADGRDVMMMLDSLPTSPALLAAVPPAAWS